MAYARTLSSVDSTGYRLAAWGGVGLQAIALVAVLWIHGWSGAFSLAIFLALSAGFLLMQDRLPSLFSLLVVVAALVNAFGWAWNWFNQFVWYDEVVHLFSSFAVLAAIAWMAWSQRWVTSQPGSGKFILQIAAIGLVIGIAWEIFEVIVISIGFIDTITDLIMDVIGAAAGGWLAGTIINREREAGAVSTA